MPRLHGGKGRGWEQRQRENFHPQKPASVLKYESFKLMKTQIFAILDKMNIGYLNSAAAMLTTVKVTNLPL
jgi:hypothetical protein